MIPQAYIDEWRQSVPWQDDIMVEQDLLISRSMIALFSDEFLAEKLAFRGGTALHKLFSREAPRYSEDLDLIQKTGEPIKPICDQIRSVMGWLDEKPAYKQKGDIFTFYFKFQPEGPIDAMRKIKVEINCREHTPYLGNKEIPYEISCNSQDLTRQTPSFRPDNCQSCQASDEAYPLHHFPSIPSTLFRSSSKVDEKC